MVSHQTQEVGDGSVVRITPPYIFQLRLRLAEAPGAEMRHRAFKKLCYDVVACDGRNRFFGRRSFHIMRHGCCVSLVLDGCLPDWPAARNYADGPAKEQYRSRFESVAKLHNLRDTSLAIHRQAE